jgi:hypothetical protein
VILLKSTSKPCPMASIMSDWAPAWYWRLWASVLVFSRASRSSSRF